MVSIPYSSMETGILKHSLTVAKLRNMRPRLGSKVRDNSESDT